MPRPRDATVAPGLLGGDVSLLRHPGPRRSPWLEIRTLHPEAPHLGATDLLDLPEEPDIRLSVAATFGIASDLQVPAFSRRTEYVPDIDPDLPVRPRHHAGDPGRLRPQPARPDPGLSRHRQVDAHRAGGRPAELALHPHQPRQPHQPHRPDRQGRDRPQGRQADHRVSRGHPALVAAAAGGAGVRRVRRRPARRDVRYPARARGARAA